MSSAVGKHFTISMGTTPRMLQPRLGFGHDHEPVYVYAELLNTHNLSPSDLKQHGECFLVSDDVMDLILKYIKNGGYAGMTLAEYLDSFYPSR